MESQAYSSSSSTSLSSFYLQEEKKLVKPQSPPAPSFQASLHSVRKIPAKPWKKPIAPLPPTPPRIYKVACVDFKEVVQRLTGAGAVSDFQPAPSRLLHRPASMPLSLSAGSAGDGSATTLQVPPLSTTFTDEVAELVEKPRKQPESFESPLGLFSLSPRSHAWFSFPLMSPGAQSSS
ncbi:hypothetical protein NMG60_11025937 [Bertholletia excelsa]